MSPFQRKRKPRCPGCGLPPRSCACDQIPRVRIATPIAIVQHINESYKPTNTGRLFVRMAEGTLLLPCGMRGTAFDPAPLRDPSVEWLLLFPRKGAPVLEAGRKPAPGRRLGFVLLDGSWSQCSHMSHRLPGVTELPCVALPPGPPSFWTVRTQHHEQGRSTFEAATDLVQLFEGPAAAEPLRRAFAVITARLLHLKGRLRSPEIPASWGI